MIKKIKQLWKDKKIRNKFGGDIQFPISDSSLPYQVVNDEGKVIERVIVPEMSIEDDSNMPSYFILHKELPESGLIGKCKYVPEKVSISNHVWETYYNTLVALTAVCTDEKMKNIGQGCINLIKDSKLV